MSNVIQFSKPSNVVQLPTARAEEKPAVEAPIAVNPTTEVVRALLFYARQGWDGGAKAKKALVAMGVVAQPQASEPESA